MTTKEPAAPAKVKQTPVQLSAQEKPENKISKIGVILKDKKLPPFDTILTALITAILLFLMIANNSRVLKSQGVEFSFAIALIIDLGYILCPIQLARSKTWFLKLVWFGMFFLMLSISCLIHLKNPVPEFNKAISVSSLDKINSQNDLIHIKRKARLSDLDKQISDISDPIKDNLAKLNNLILTKKNYIDKGLITKGNALTSAQIATLEGKIGSATINKIAFLNKSKYQVSAEYPLIPVTSISASPDKNITGNFFDILAWPIAIIILSLLGVLSMHTLITELTQDQNKNPTLTRHFKNNLYSWSFDKISSWFRLKNYHGKPALKSVKSGDNYADIEPK